VSEGPRLALRLAYLGTSFAGWQAQTRQRTVQGELERALARLYGEPIRAVGAGRTDSGVHAAGQVAHFDTPCRIPPAGVRAALNTMLPDDLRVLQVWVPAAGFHARHDAVGKRYRYQLAWGRVLTPWEGQRSWCVPQALTAATMVRAAQALVGTYDFAAFACSGHTGTGRRGTTRTLHRVAVCGRGRRLAIIVEGDAFLRAMVRRLAGALVEVGTGAQPPGWIGALIANPATLPPAPTAPACGLTLEKVFY
jgi:tRNA pseudouridine38-40 synthase